MADGDDAVKGLGPDYHYAFISLRPAKVSGSHLGKIERTMKAAHCSLSACGSMSIVSRIWMRVSASTWMLFSSAALLIQSVNDLRSRERENRTCVGKNRIGRFGKVGAQI